MNGTEPATVKKEALSAFSSKRLALIIMTAALLAGAGLLYNHFWVSRPIGDGEAGLPIARELFSATWNSQPVLLVGMGDSVTAGFGARRGYGYFDRLSVTPPDEFPAVKGLCLSTVFPDLHVTNLAVSGSVSKELVEAQLPRLRDATPETIGLVVITTGGNDLIHNYGRSPAREHSMYGATLEQAKPWIENFDRRLGAIVSEVTSRFPGGCHIFLANIYDPTDGAGDIERAGLPAWPEAGSVLAGYNEVVQRCCEKHAHVHLVNLHDAFLGHGIHCTQIWSKHYDSRDPHYWYYQNLEDPNERGYDAIRRLFLVEIAKVARRMTNKGP